MSLKSYLAEIGFAIPKNMESKPDKTVKFHRIDDKYYSTLVCKCGETFTWSSIDPRLCEWVDEHFDHVQ